MVTGRVGGSTGGGVTCLDSTLYASLFTIADASFCATAVYTADESIGFGAPSWGTHDGPLGPFPATSNEFALPLCEMWHFDPSGRVVGGDLYYDQVSLLMQLGLMPQPSGA